MIIFITNKQHKVLETEIVKIQNTITNEDLIYIQNQPILGFDLETNALDPFISDILLLIIGTKDKQFVIDIHSFSEKEQYDLFFSCFKENKIFLGANCKFDYSFIKVKYNISILKMFDVMIAEQRIRQGFPTSNSLAAIVERRLKYIPNEMKKDIRLDFIGANKNNFIFENKHIEYAAGDIKYLFDIRELQKESISKLNLEFLIYNIEFPLIRRLADAELNGFVLNENKWKDLIKSNEENKFIKELELDEEFRKLRNYLPKEEQIYIKNGKWDRVRLKKQKTQTLDLFSNIEEIETNKFVKSKKEKFKSPYINYSSTSELVYIFASLGLSLPTKLGEYITPTFTIKKGKRVIDKSLHSFTTGKQAIESYVIENPNSIGENFVKTLIKYRKYTTRLNTFGEEFLIKYKNPITNKFHTVFRQAHAITGRLQSGDESSGRFNSQNIPAEKDYRECFYFDKDYLICTTDLSSAEAVIMIDKARDDKFYKMAILNDDAHSPLATAVWREIFKYRGNEKLANTFVVSKEENKHLRTAFKPMTFGSIYGMFVKKTAKTLSITLEEAKIALKTIKTMIPKTFKMVENNSKFAQENGYIVLNTRTNSRIWYPDIMISKNNNSEIPFDILHEVDGSARNAPIQGTQADMLKEAIVEIGKEIDRQNLNIKLLGQVHDELIYAIHKDIIEVEFIKDNKEVELVKPELFIQNWMCQVANRYLSFIKMTASTHIGTTWTK
jgi:DNA polymerase I-like protein with 3'-5' exonuclease and polymerase domains